MKTALSGDVLQPGETLSERLSGWFEMLPERTPPTPVSGRLSADVAVVGAGFTGLAAARQLAVNAPGARIVVLDSQRVGMGSSGRNSGFLVDVAHYNHRLSLEGNLALTRLQRAGIAALSGCVHDHAIECEWSPQGRLHAAVGATGTRALTQFCEGLDAMGEQYARLTSESLVDTIGTDYYRSAVHTPGGVLVQPAALVTGLARSLPSNVELYEESPVQHVDLADRGGARLTTARGSVSAPNIIVAVNAASGDLGLNSIRVFPMMTFASLSEPIEGSRATWGLVCEDPMGTTLRSTPDGRILVRNSLRFGRRTGLRDGEAVVSAHRRSFLARFPDLAAVPFEYSWGGVVGVTANRVPSFGQIRPGIYASGGCNGVGMALGTVSGMLMADMVAGVESPLLDDVLRLPKPGFVPPRVVLEPIARASLRWKQSRAGADC